MRRAANTTSAPAFDRTFAKWTNPLEADKYLQMSHGGPENYQIMQIVEPDGSQYWIHVPKTGLRYGQLRTGRANLTDTQLNQEIMGAWNKHNSYEYMKSINNPTGKETALNKLDITDEEFDAVYDYLMKNGTGKKTSP